MFFDNGKVYDQLYVVWMAIQLIPVYTPIIINFDGYMRSGHY